MKEAGVWIQQGFADASGLAPGTQATLASQSSPLCHLQWREAESVSARGGTMT